MPSSVNPAADIRVTPRSLTSLLQTLTDAGIPHHIIADDLHRFSSTACLPRVAVQNAVCAVAQ